VIHIFFDSYARTIARLLFWGKCIFMLNLISIVKIFVILYIMIDDGGK